MKRILIIVLAALAAMMVALPAAASTQGSIAYLDWPWSYDDYLFRGDLIDENAFQNAAGITTVQLSTGNGNVLQSNTRIALANADVDDLVGTVALAFDPESGESYVMRRDKIADNAFQNVAGITTVQMSSGNGNALQANVNIEVKPWY